MSRSSDQSPSPDLLECIEMRHWQGAIDIVATNHNAVYQRQRRRGSIHHSPNNYNSNRLAIHELCKLASCPTSVRFSKEEFSEDEEEDDEHEDSATNPSDETAELDKIFDACELEEGTKIYDVTQFMIDVSHSLGPTKVAISPDADTDDGDHENDNNENMHNLEINPAIEGHGEAEGNGNEINAAESRVYDNRDDNRDAGNLDQEEDIENDENHSRRHDRSTAIHESILTVKDSMGKTPLHVLCENSCDTNMMKVILESSRDATGNPRAPTVLSLVLAKDSRGSTPLHYLAYSRQCPFSTLKLMMDYCQPRPSIDPTLCTDEDGETPLHWALGGYMSPRRIKELTRHSLDAIMARDQKGKRPFDHFTTNFVDSDWTEHDVCGKEVWENVQQYLCVVHSNYSRKKNKFSHVTTRSSAADEGCNNYFNGDSKPQQRSINRLVAFNEPRQGFSEWLPLHFIAGSPYDFPPIFTDLALKYRKEDLQKADRHGNIPLHLACGRRCASIRNNNNEPETETQTNTPAKSGNGNTATDNLLGLKLLKAFPRASLIRSTTTNQLPLHVAVRAQQPMPLIAALIRTYPRSLNIQDPITKLLPYALAGLEDGTSDEAKGNDSLWLSFALLRADPSVLHLRNLTDADRRPWSEGYDRATFDKKPMGVDESYTEHSSRRIRRLTIR